MIEINYKKIKKNITEFITDDNNTHKIKKNKSIIKPHNLNNIKPTPKIKKNKSIIKQHNSNNNSNIDDLNNITPTPKIKKNKSIIKQYNSNNNSNIDDSNNNLNTDDLNNNLNIDDLNNNSNIDDLNNNSNIDDLNNNTDTSKIKKNKSIKKTSDMEDDTKLDILKNTDNYDNNILLIELLKKQLKNIQNDKKLSYNDIKRISKFLVNSIFDENKCCIWNGYITNEKNQSKGTYINFYFNKKKIALHRLLYINYIADINNDEYLKFTCENKGKCCNIYHMKKFNYNKNMIKSNLINSSNDDDSKNNINNLNNNLNNNINNLNNKDDSKKTKISKSENKFIVEI